MVPLWGVILIGTHTYASFCGKSGVPFSVEVLPSGAPVLGCAQPSCVAQPADDFDDSVFNTDLLGQVDGFFREGDKTRQGYLQTNKLRANCSGDFDQLACTRKNQWIGGIEYIDHPRQPLLLQCCTFEGLRFSQIVGVTPIGPGEAVTGGEVVRDGRQISFDVIANIRKVVDQKDQKTISYEVAVRRMNCLPDPPEVEISVDADVEDELLRVLESAYNGSMPLGHEGHAHMEKEKETMSLCDHSHRGKCKNKKRNNERDFTSDDRPESFGAPIYNPIPENNRHTDYSRHFITTTPHTDDPPIVQKDVTSTMVPTPSFVFPTIAPFTFPTLPSVPQLFILPSFTPLPTELTPLSVAPQPHAFGVSQTNLSPLSAPSTYPHLLPIAQFYRSPFDTFMPRHHSMDGLQEKSLNNLSQEHPRPFDIRQHFSGFGLHDSISPQHVSSSLYNPSDTATQHLHQLSFPPRHQLFDSLMHPINLQGMVSESNKPGNEQKYGLDEKSELAEPTLPPRRHHLGTLFQPPPFSALSSAIQNFQAQG